MAKFLIEDNMQLLEEEIMPEYPERGKLRPKSSTVNHQVESERPDMKILVASTNTLAASVREVVKKTKKIKNFLGLTREMLLKNRNLGIFKNEAPLLRSLNKIN